MTEIERALEMIAGARRVMVTCHLGPDGDAFGSMSAMASILRTQGREVTLYNPDGVPRGLRFVPLADAVVRNLPTAPPFDLTIVMDCGDRKLLGPKFPGPEVTGPLLVIDHHTSTRPFGEVYLCDPGASSIGVIVARLAGALGFAITPAAALAIYVSLVSDTGSFRYANTNAESLTLAARLVGELGVDPWAVAQALGEQQPIVRYRLLASALAAIELEVDGRVAVMIVTDEMVQKAGAKWEHSEGLVNYARAIEGVECGVLLTPARDGGVRVSLRSKGAIDAGAICAPFGGGGHRGAAGCVVQAPISDVRAQIIAALGAAIRVR